MKMVPGPCGLQGREESRPGLSQEPSSPLPLGKASDQFPAGVPSQPRSGRPTEIREIRKPPQAAGLRGFCIVGRDYLL